MGSRKMDKSEVNHYGSVVWEFFEKSQKYKSVKAKFDAIKERFESEMDTLFAGRQSNSIVVTNYDLDDDQPNAIKVSKIERTTIRWDVDKLRKRIPKGIFSKVVRKEYKVVNMPQLVRYLKSCGVDPEIFKQHIVVEQSVDQDAVDQMGELGYLSPKQISGCYIVDCAKPYYKVSMVKRKDDE